MFKRLLDKIFSTNTEVQIVDDRNRFNLIYQQMLAARWRVTLLTVLTMMVVICGVTAAIANKVAIPQGWEQVIFLLLGSFLTYYGRTFDFWFNSSQRDEKLLEKMDQENDTDQLVLAKLKNERPPPGRPRAAPPAKPAE